jgi:hypothetical protein
MDLTSPIAEVAFDDRVDSWAAGDGYAVRLPSELRLVFLLPSVERQEGHPGLPQQMLA